MPTDQRPASARFSRSRLLLGAILLAAGILRMARLDLMPFEMDEGIASILTIRYTHLGFMPLEGVKTSVGFHNSPLFIFVLVPVYLISTDPRVAALLFALLGLAAVYVVYRTGREFFSTGVGLLAAALMAFSPAAVDYSRRLWGHSLIQAICPVVFYLMLRWIVTGRPKVVFWLGLLIAAAQQFHFSGALLWAPMVAAWVLFRPRTDWPAFLCGLVAGLLAYVPFLAGQVFSDYADLRTMVRLIFHGAGRPPGQTMASLSQWFFAATDLGHNNFMQQEYGAFLAQIPFYRATRALLGVAWLAALVGCAVWAVRELRGAPLRQALRGGRGVVPVMLLLWSVVPLVAFLVLGVPVVAPYFLVVYPAPFLLIAWGIMGLWRRVETSREAPGLRYYFLAAIEGLVVVWLAHQVAFHAVLGYRLDRDGGGVGSYASLGAQEAAMRFVARHAAAEALGRPLVISHDQVDPRRGIDYRFWFLLWRHQRDMDRFFPPDRDQAAYWYVIRNTHYRVEPEFAAFLKNFPWRPFGFLRVYVVSRPGPWPKFLKDEG